MTPDITARVIRDSVISNYNTQPSRPLTDAEKDFTERAHAGYFAVLYDCTGEPFAIGCRNAMLDGSIEHQDPVNRDQSIYLMERE